MFFLFFSRFSSGNEVVRQQQRRQRRVRVHPPGSRSRLPRCRFSLVAIERLPVVDEEFVGPAARHAASAVRACAGRAVKRPVVQGMFAREVEGHAAAFARWGCVMDTI